MKKLLMIVTISGFVAATNVFAASTKGGDDKDKKCSAECKKKCAKEGKDCEKEGYKCCKDEKMACCKKGEKKACCKKGEKQEETKPTNTQPSK